MEEQKSPPVAAPVTPAPVPVKKEMTRADFLWTAWAAFVAFIGAGMGAMGKFMLPNVLYEASQIFKAGKPEDYDFGVSTKWMKEQRVWVIKAPAKLYVIWARCTHLGCTPNWWNAEQRFKCPCHGSNYNIEGDVLAGPAPKPLNRCAISLLASGEILVDKSVLEDRPGLREKKPFYIDLKSA